MAQTNPMARTLRDNIEALTARRRIEAERAPLSDRVADRRADLDLHVNLLAEHELTKLAQLVERIAARLEIATDDPDFQEIREDVQPVRVLEALDAQRKEEGIE